MCWDFRGTRAKGNIPCISGLETDSFSAFTLKFLDRGCPGISLDWVIV